MKKLVKYFFISLFFNLLLLSVFMLHSNKIKPKRVRNIADAKTPSLLPANLLSDIAQDKKNVEKQDLNFKPDNTEEKTTNNKNNDSAKHATEENKPKKEIIEIPDQYEKQEKYLSKEEYEIYKKSLPKEGTLVTNMRVKFPPDITTETIREIIIYFDFKIVAYPHSKPGYLLVCNGNTLRFEKLATKGEIEGFYLNNSNRTIELESDLLYLLKKELLKQNVLEEDLKVSLALGCSAGYFHWKEIQAIKYISANISDVSYTNARIVKTPQGYWILLVEDVYLKDGTFRKVEDQELKEIVL